MELRATKPFSLSRGLKATAFAVGLVLALAGSAGAADPEPTVTGGFDDTTIVVGETGVLTLTIENETLELIEFLNIENEFPEALELNPAASSKTCTGQVAFNGSKQNVLLSGVTLAAGDSCVLELAFVSTEATTFTNNGDAIEIFTDATPADPAGRTVHPDPASDPDLTITVSEPLPPTITVAATPSVNIVAGQTVDLVYTITNPNPVVLSHLNIDIEFSIAGLFVNSTQPPTTTCGNGTAATAPPLFLPQLRLGNLGPNASCTFTTRVWSRSTAEGTYTITADAYQDATPDNTFDNNRTQYTAPDVTLTVAAPLPPTITVAATPSVNIVAGQTVDLVYTITNPNPVVLSHLNIDIEFSIAGLFVNSTQPPTTTCGNGTAATAPPLFLPQLRLGNLGPNASCTFTTRVWSRSTAEGTYTITADAYQDATPDNTFDNNRTQYTAPDVTLTVSSIPQPLTILDVPCPVYDSRTATASIGGTLDGDDSRRLSATGILPVDQGVGTGECVPDGASAVVFTISAIDPVAGGNLRLSPAGIEPTGGVVNYAANSLNNANTVTIPLSVDGQVDLSANGGSFGQFLPSTDARLVVLGYYSTDGDLEYNAVTPCAVADSRMTQGADGTFEGPFSAGIFPEVDVVGPFPGGQGGGNTDCGVPSGAGAVLVNVVAVNPGGGTGYLSVGPGGTIPTEPLTPFADIGMNNATTTVVAVDASGKIAVNITATFGSPTTNVRVVVLGYYDTSGLEFNSVTPCTAWDTRSNQNSTGSFLGERLGDSTTTYDVTGTFDAAQGGNNTTCDVPDGAEAVLVNLVAINAHQGGNLRISAGGTIASGGVLNFDALSPAMNNANAVVVPLNANGELDVFTNGGMSGAGIPIAHIRGVILGYYD